MKIRTSADIAEFERISPEERGWCTSTYEALVRCANATPDQPALSVIADAAALTRTASLSYSELLAQVNRMANLLRELGAGTTDVTAYFLPNLIETQIVLWGSQAAGIAFPINTLLSPENIVALLNEAKVRVLVTAPARRESGWPGWAALRPHLRACRNLEHVLLVDDDVSLAGQADTEERFTVSSLQAGLASQPPELLSQRTFAAADVSSYFCTGGTTGAPKIAIRTHRAEAANAHMLSTMLGDALAGGRLLIGLPLFHVNAALTSFTTWLNGGEVVLASYGYRDPAVMANFWRIVAHNGINFFSAVPTILSDLLGRPIDGDVSSLRFAICGAAPLSTELFQRFEDATGLRILEGYGLTESTCVATINPFHGERRIGSVGLRLPYERLCCIQLDDQGLFVVECEVGEVGVVVLSGPNVFTGYSSAAHEKGLWVELGDGNRWLNTGDLGSVDKDGYLRLTGRSKDLIIRSGHNIDPALIEEALYRHPAVKLAAAIGRPDSRAGEVPVAYVTLHSGSETTAADLLALVTTTISDRAAVPKAISIVDEMPVTPVGKISKILLVEREVCGIIRSIAERLGELPTAIEVTTTSSGPQARLSGATDALLAELTDYPFRVQCADLAP